MKPQILTGIVIAAILVVSLTFITTHTVDSWPHHSCCTTVLVYKKSNTWAALKAGGDVWVWEEESDCDDFWHGKFWPHGDPCD